MACEGNSRRVYCNERETEVSMFGRSPIKPTGTYALLFTKYSGVVLREIHELPSGGRCCYFNDDFNVDMVLLEVSGKVRGYSNVESWEPA